MEKVRRKTKSLRKLTLPVQKKGKQCTKKKGGGISQSSNHQTKKSEDYNPEKARSCSSGPAEKYIVSKTSPSSGQGLKDSHQSETPLVSVTCKDKPDEVASENDKKAQNEQENETTQNTKEVKNENQDIHDLAAFMFSKFALKKSEEETVLNQLSFQSFEKSCAELLSVCRNLDSRTAVTTKDESAPERAKPIQKPTQSSTSTEEDEVNDLL